jgi:hypothetical protein
MEKLALQTVASDGNCKIFPVGTQVFRCVLPCRQSVFTVSEFAENVTSRILSLFMFHQNIFS